jgi:hypothetical protein
VASIPSNHPETSSEGAPVKKIMIVERDDKKGRELAHWLGTVFPECEIHVLRAAPAKNREREKEGEQREKRRSLSVHDPYTR